MSENPKRKLIRDNAFTLMMAYGFQRTSMDDIAKACGMSRPALYLVYKNKEDICRDMVKSVVDQCILGAESALAAHGPLKTRLLAIIDAGLLEAYFKIAQSPHGADLIATGSALAGNLIVDWRVRLVALLARGIGGPHAQAHANLIVDAIDGMKLRTKDAGEMRRGIDTLLSLIVGRR